MTGLKSGSGDDLWDDETDDTDETDRPDDGKSEDETENDEPHRTTTKMTETESTSETETPSESESRSEPATRSETGNQTRPYIVRRAVRNKSVQFERDERLTFFVHGDVADGERELLTEVESALGRDVPKFDLREAVYRAALRNRDDVLDELSEMGYSR